MRLARAYLRYLTRERLMLPRDFYRLTNVEVHFVYLLVHAHLPRFKIGVSSNPAQRAKDLRQPFDLAMSRQFGFTKSEAYRVEDDLHNRYEALNLDVSTIGKCSGQTEWFDISCFNDCKLAVHLENWIVPVSQISPFPWIIVNRAGLLSRGIFSIDGLPLILPPIRSSENQLSIDEPMRTGRTLLSHDYLFVFPEASVPDSRRK